MLQIEKDKADNWKGLDGQLVSSLVKATSTDEEMKRREQK